MRKPPHWNLPPDDEERGCLREAPVDVRVLRQAEAVEYLSGVDCTEEEEYDRLHGLEKWDPDWWWQLYDPGLPVIGWPYQNPRKPKRKPTGAACGRGSPG